VLHILLHRKEEGIKVPTVEIGWWLIIVCVISLSCQKQNTMSANLPDPFLLEMVANEFHWEIRYPGMDGKLHTGDDFFSNQDIHLPEGVEVEVSLKSEDYLYFISVPALDKRSIAVPGLEKKLIIAPHSDDDIALIGNQSCGFKHETLNRQIVFDERNDFIDWSLKESKR